MNTSSIVRSKRWNKFADFDNDGLFDLFAADMLSHTHYRRKTVVSTNSQNKYTNLVEHNYFLPVVRNVLQRNNGDGTFSDIACLAVSRRQIGVGVACWLISTTMAGRICW